MFKRKDKIIIDGTRCDILGNSLEYDMENEYDIELICKFLNEFFEGKMILEEILRIMHGIKYGDLEYEALDDYIYKGVDINDIFKDDLKV